MLGGTGVLWERLHGQSEGKWSLRHQETAQRKLWRGEGGWGGGGSGEGKEGGGEGVERGRRVGGGSGEGKVGGGGREWVGFVAHLTCVVLCDALYLPHGNYWDTKS